MTTDPVDAGRAGTRSGPGRTPTASPNPRRAVLLSAGADFAAALAGCLGSDGGGDSESPAETRSTATSTTSATSGPSGALDLREANVVGVAVERSGNEYTFDVALHHDVHESEALVSQPERRAFW